MKSHIPFYYSCFFFLCRLWSFNSSLPILLLSHSFLPCLCFSPSHSIYDSQSSKIVTGARFLPEELSAITLFFPGIAWYKVGKESLSPCAQALTATPRRSLGPADPQGPQAFSSCCPHNHLQKLCGAMVQRCRQFHIGRFIESSIGLSLCETNRPL